MGNRGTVVFTDGKKNFSSAVYLHWNGGPESIYGFLAELDRRQIRADQDYETARFIQIVGEFFDQDSINGLSLGVVNGPKNDSIKELSKIQTDLSDNGVYLVCRNNGNSKIRRFTEDYENCPLDTTGHKDYGKLQLREWSVFEVEREKKEAMKSDYIPHFAEFFQKPYFFTICCNIFIACNTISRNALSEYPII